VITEYVFIAHEPKAQYSLLLDLGPVGCGACGLLAGLFWSQVFSIESFQNHRFLFNESRGCLHQPPTKDALQDLF
jgi:hypothetical protein